VNWGFRLKYWEGIAGVREEIARDFRPHLAGLQRVGDGYRDGQVFRSFGIVFVPDSYERR
jgi:hypothetical protein